MPRSTTCATRPAILQDCPYTEISQLNILFIVNLYITTIFASEGVGFEPTGELPPQQFSRLSHSTALPSLQIMVKLYHSVTVFPASFHFAGLVAIRLSFTSSGSSHS